MAAIVAEPAASTGPSRWPGSLMYNGGPAHGGHFPASLTKKIEAAPVAPAQPVPVEAEREEDAF